MSLFKLGQTDLISNKFDNEIKIDSSNSAKTYQNVSSTGITRTNKNSGKSEFDGYGEYFTENSNIHNNNSNLIYVALFANLIQSA